ncbi:uncharacterized protein LOC128960230, partial [Oppia nitens]|uniref:uncharacterized protein LOC128960230 n=1 Tax=Oppia nitens TaxID=1686743 RepID=UPI0023DC466B
CDFTGYTLYIILHQLFFTAYAVYVLVIDISEDLEAPLELSKDDTLVTELHKGDLSTLNIIHMWLTIIHSTVGRYPTSTEIEKEEEWDNQTKLQPQVLLVATHRNSVHVEPITRDQIIKESFEKIYSSLEGKTYKNHLNENYLALDCDEMSYDEPILLNELKANIEKIVIKEKLVNFDIPAPWMEFEQILEKLKQRGIYFADINQLHEFACSRIDAFQSYDALNAALHFYHNQGKVFCVDHIGYFSLFESQNAYDSGIIILDPIWFLQCIYKLCSYIKQVSDDDNAQGRARYYRKHICA